MTAKEKQYVEKMERMINILIYPDTHDILSWRKERDLLISEISQLKSEIENEEQPKDYLSDLINDPIFIPLKTEQLSAKEIIGDRFKSYKNYMSNKDGDNLIEDILSVMHEFECNLKT